MSDSAPAARDVRPSYVVDLPVDFETLRTERKLFGDICRLHLPSVMWFKHPEKPWFRLTRTEQLVDRDLRHLSSSASCIESLLEDSDGDIGSLADDFAEAALSADTWESEGAARVYCRVRTLPAILKFASEEILKRHARKIEELATYAWNRVNVRDEDRQGVSEAPDRDIEAEASEEADEVAEWRGYPPNAFHTFWAIRVLEELERRSPQELELRDDALGEKRAIAELWARRTLATQTSLVGIKAQRRDANQLAWALATQFIHPPMSPLTAESEEVELYRAGLEAFFSDQLPTGRWPLYEPIFHFPQAGNAYCYTYETLTELLRPALHRDGRVLRELLRPFANNLLDAWHYAARTRIPLEGPEEVGWCSGHHPHRASAEGWATASVFSFLQCLRRLVAEWTAEIAESDLGVRQPKFTTRHEALETLRERGDTWTREGEWNAAREIAGLFVHPVDSLDPERMELDRDRTLVRDSHARAAILYGPPGTSKTTLAEAVAGAIGWQFVAVHASDFLNRGMDFVPTRADEIFSRLMELDHCVVLFDEIDELLRERKPELDPFGRFLTTSMLPKIAQLWEQGRVLYFVSTNDIAGADPAIKRSQRFDAAIYVAPPSWRVKEQQLKAHLNVELPTGLNWKAVVGALDKGAIGEEGALEGALGVLALLRWDQIPELVSRLNASAESGTLNLASIEKELAQFGRELEETDWHKEVSQDGKVSKVDPLKIFEQFREHRRRDTRRDVLARPLELMSALPEGVEVFSKNEHFWRVNGLYAGVDEVSANGYWVLRSADSCVLDDGLLNFRPCPSDPS